MSGAVNLLNPNLGLSGFIDQAGETGRLPQPRPLATGVAPETGLADLFRPANFQSLVLAGLAPRIGDESLLRPDILRRNLEAGLERLKKNRRPEVRRFVREDLAPLLEDRELLQSCVNLMMGG
jgi:type III secretion protein X